MLATCSRRLAELCFSMQPGQSLAWIFVLDHAYLIAAENNAYSQTGTYKYSCQLIFLTWKFLRYVRMLK